MNWFSDNWLWWLAVFGPAGLLLYQYRRRNEASGAHHDHGTHEQSSGSAPATAGAPAGAAADGGRAKTAQPHRRHGC